MSNNNRKNKKYPHYHYLSLNYCYWMISLHFLYPSSNSHYVFWLTISSNIPQLILILIQIHILLQLLLLLSNLFLSQVINQFIHIIIFNLLITTLHHILCHLVHNLHLLFLSHELLYCLLIIFVTHLWICTLHYLCHPLHHVFHWLVYAHLL